MTDLVNDTNNLTTQSTSSNEQSSICEQHENHLDEQSVSTSTIPSLDRYNYTLTLEFMDQVNDGTKYIPFRVSLVRSNITHQNNKLDITNYLLYCVSILNSGNKYCLEINGSNCESLVSNLFADYKIHSRDDNGITYAIINESRYDVIVRFLSLGTYRTLLDLCKHEASEHLNKLGKYIYSFCRTYRYELLLLTASTLCVATRCFQC